MAALSSTIATGDVQWTYICVSNASAAVIAWDALPCIGGKIATNQTTPALRSLRWSATYLDRPAVVHRSPLNTHTWRSFVGIIDIYVRTTRPLIVSFRRNTHTSTMQNSVLEPASHGTDFVIAVVPSVFVDTTFRRKDCTRPRGGNSRSTTSAEKARHVERMNPSTGM